MCYRLGNGSEISACFCIILHTWRGRVRGCGKMQIAEYRCVMGYGLGLASGVRVGSWLGLGLRSGLGFYFAAVLRNFSQSYVFRIAQMRNGYGVKITVRVSG